MLASTRRRLRNRAEDVFGFAGLCFYVILLVVLFVGCIAALSFIAYLIAKGADGDGKTAFWTAFVVLTLNSISITLKRG